MSRRVQEAVNIGDLRKLARRRLPKMIFDFIDGGAEDETTLRNNRRQFERWGLIPHHPVDVSKRSLEVEIFGTTYAAPIIISPTGLAALTRGHADLHLARGARRFGIPFTMSTAATATIESAAEAADGNLWFQLYILRDRELVVDMMKRAHQAGVRVLVVSLDCPIVGQRERDIRNAFTLPFRPNTHIAWNMLFHTKWLWDLIRHGMPSPVNLGPQNENGQALVARFQAQLDPSVSWSDIAWVRAQWPGKLVIKGLISPADAVGAVEHGADGVVVSNQGGRQLDSAVPTLEALPLVLDAVGSRCVVFCDGGFRRGTDIIKALSLGAKAVFLGRATLYGAAAGAEAGVFKALTLLGEELDRAMALVGARTPAEIDRDKIWDLQDYV